MKILITGSSGYIGSVLTKMALEKGHNVRAVDRFFFGDNLPEHKNLEKIQRDCRDLEDSLFDDIDAVIDLVAISNDPSGEYFKTETIEINHQSRARTANIAKMKGVKRYILPSSCSIYGFNEGSDPVDELSETNPLTTYAVANENAEKDILPLTSDNFCVTVIRQATVFGYSPRMRFDLAINGMTYGAWKTRKLPLMRDGKQWRPMVHVMDTSRAMLFLLEQKIEDINGEIYNIGSKKCTYQLGPLANIVANEIGNDVKIEWYGDVDHRSYNVSFEKIKRLGFDIKYDAVYGIKEISEKLADGTLEKTSKTITLDWYKLLEEWFDTIKDMPINGSILKIKK